MDIGHSEDTSQLIRGNFHWTRRRRCAGFRLRKSSGARGVERDIALDFLHGLMNMPVQDCYRTEALEIAERLRAVFSTPAPVGIDRPERDVREDNDGRA